MTVASGLKKILFTVISMTNEYHEVLEKEYPGEVDGVIIKQLGCLNVKFYDIRSKATAEIAKKTRFIFTSLPKHIRLDAIAPHDLLQRLAFQTGLLGRMGDIAVIGRQFFMDIGGVELL